MNTVERARLEQLIQFLEQLDPARFDFQRVVKEKDENGCGTVCCAMGWTPALFPELIGWYTAKKALPGLGENPYQSFLAVENRPFTYAGAAERLFGIPCYTAHCLFMPGGQKYVHRSLPDLNRYASPQVVAQMLKEFLKLLDNGEIQLDEY